MTWYPNQGNRVSSIDQLTIVYDDFAVVVAKLKYASSSWWGFTTASDRQRLGGFLRRGCRQNLYSTDKPSITQITRSHGSVRVLEGRPSKSMRMAKFDPQPT